MRQVCTRCYTVAPDGTSWCKTSGCPAGTLSVLFDPGETISEFNVLSTVQVFRTTALYRVQRGRERMLLKVAHRRCEELLKNEARLLSHLQHENLPKLLPASSIHKDHAYERTTIGDEMKYFLVMQNVEGVFLPEYLEQRGRFTDQHAIWLALQVADALVYLHRAQQILVRNLHSGGLLLRIDPQAQVPIPLLLDLTLAGPAGPIQDDTLAQFGVQNTLAPEVLRRGVITEQTDVYGLGLLLYETLTGQPAYQGKLRDDAGIRQSVLSSSPRSLKEIRPEIDDRIAVTVATAVRQSGEARQQTVGTVGRELHRVFGDPPTTKKKSGSSGGGGSRRMVMIAAIIVLVLVLVGLAVFMAATLLAPK